MNFQIEEDSKLENFIFAFSDMTKHIMELCEYNKEVRDFLLAIVQNNSTGPKGEEVDHDRKAKDKEHYNHFINN